MSSKYSKWTYKGHTIKGNRKGYSVFNQDGKRWLGSYSWTQTLRRISTKVNQELVRVRNMKEI